MAQDGPPDTPQIPVMPASDWSIRLNSPTSLSQAQLLQELGRHLRGQYEGILAEPLPRCYRRPRPSS